MGKFNLGGALGSDLLNETSKAMKISQDFNVIPIDINLIESPQKITRVCSLMILKN